MHKLLLLLFLFAIIFAYLDCHVLAERLQDIAIPDNSFVPPSATDKISVVPRSRKPHWSYDGSLRTVSFVLYFATFRPKATDFTWLERLLGSITAQFGHSEVHVGMTAFSMYAEHQLQEIQTRSVADSNRVFGQKLYRKIAICETMKTDDQILAYMERAQNEPYNAITNTCRKFSQRLIDYVCPGAKIPNQYRIVERMAPRLLSAGNTLDRAFMGKIFKNEKSAWRRMLRHYNEKYSHSRWEWKEWEKLSKSSGDLKS